MLYASIAAAPNGDATAAWFQAVAGVNSVFAVRYVSAVGQWTAPVVVDDGGSSADFPEVAVDGSGNIFVVWVQVHGLYTSVWAARYLAGAGVWTSPEVVESTSGTANFPRVAATAGGGAVVVWFQEGATPGTYDIWANIFR